MAVRVRGGVVVEVERGMRQRVVVSRRHHVNFAKLTKTWVAPGEHPLQLFAHPQVLAVASTVPLPYPCTSQSTPRGSQRDPASGLSTLPESRQVYTHSSSLYLSLASLTMP